MIVQENDGFGCRRTTWTAGTDGSGRSRIESDSHRFSSLSQTDLFYDVETPIRPRSGPLDDLEPIALGLTVVGLAQLDVATLGQDEADRAAGYIVRLAARAGGLTHDRGTIDGSDGGHRF